MFPTLLSVTLLVALACFYLPVCDSLLLSSPSCLPGAWSQTWPLVTAAAGALLLPLPISPPWCVRAAPRSCDSLTICTSLAQAAGESGVWGRGWLNQQFHQEEMDLETTASTAARLGLCFPELCMQVRLQVCRLNLTAVSGVMSDWSCTGVTCIGSFSVTHLC